MNLETARKSVRNTFIGSCVGSVFIVLAWVFLLNKNWPTALVAGAAWGIAMTLTQVLIAWSAKHKRKRSTTQ